MTPSKQQLSDSPPKMGKLSAHVTLPRWPDDQSGLPTKCGIPTALRGHSSQEQQSGESSIPLYTSDELQPPGELLTSSLTASIDLMPLNVGNTFTSSASPDLFNRGNVCRPCNKGNDGDRAASVGKMRAALKAALAPHSASHAPSRHAKKSFQWHEERIETESRDRQELWNCLMEDLRKSQVTVKRLEEKLEDMQRLFRLLTQVGG